MVGQWKVVHLDWQVGFDLTGNTRVSSGFPFGFLVGFPLSFSDGFLLLSLCLAFSLMLESNGSGSVVSRVHDGR